MDASSALSQEHELTRRRRCICQRSVFVRMMDLGDKTLEVSRYVGGITEVHPPEGKELCRGRTICFLKKL